MANNRLIFKPKQVRIQYSQNWKEYYLVIDLDICSSFSAKISKQSAINWRKYIEKYNKELIIEEDL